MYSTHCFGQKMNSIQSCNEFEKHCRRRSILTPEDPQKKKMWGNAKEIAKCATSYKIVNVGYFYVFCMTMSSVCVFCTSGPCSVYSL